ncbi:MAG: hypothetical protein GJ677_08705 [Rhodobacteraceae bacterium]|nr:hypothetical protein [Paracoccaceae bacterium]
MSLRGSEIVEEMQSFFGGEQEAMALQRALEKLAEYVARLDVAERSRDVHNQLRSFNRLWGDEFQPEEECIDPLLNELFELHGYPESRHKPL